MYLFVTKEGSAGPLRADPPWMAQPTSSSPPPPWEPPVDPWDGPQRNVSNLNATGNEWAFSAGAGESMYAYMQWCSSAKSTVNKSKCILCVDSLFSSWSILSTVRQNNTQGTFPPHWEPNRLQYLCTVPTVDLCPPVSQC